jgi:nitrate reductase beta subunit
MEQQWWAVVNTMPGKGTPKDWEHMGGGWDAEGEPRPSKHSDCATRFGDAWQFNKDEVF